MRSVRGGLLLQERDPGDQADFFPFPDSIEVAAAAGVTAVVQPGGSMRDQQVIEAADRLGLAICFTGVRHFRH